MRCVFFTQWLEGHFIAVRCSHPIRPFAELGAGPLEAMVSVTEGVDAAYCAHELAAKHKLRIPVAEMIHRILEGEEKADHLVKVCLP